MKQILKSILFWAVIALLLLNGIILILEANGLTLRAWLLEAVIALMILAAAAGLWQLALKIPVRWLKTAAIVLCSAASVCLCVSAAVWFPVLHHPERRGEYAGKPCIIESERALWGGTHSDRYYEDHGAFVRGKDSLYVEFSIPD